MDPWHEELKRPPVPVIAERGPGIYPPQVQPLGGGPLSGAAQAVDAAGGTTPSSLGP